MDWDKRIEIREAYKKPLPKNPEKVYNCVPLMSPLEFSAFCSIRRLGLPLYPEYPVGNMFLDFADPIKKIDVELDGATYHDSSKDKIRDDILKKAGWKVFRISSSELQDIEQILLNVKQEYYG